MTNNNQDVVWKANYAPFGEADISVNTVTNNLRFPGQYFDNETGLHYNYFRYYDPTTGRYITSDPIGLDGGINTYGYALQNPILFVDPLGLDALCGAGQKAVPFPGYENVYNCVPHPTEPRDAQIPVEPDALMYPPGRSMADQWGQTRLILGIQGITLPFLGVSG